MGAQERPPLKLSNLKAIFYWHYTDVKSRRTPEQEKAEEYLFGSIRYNRWMLVPAAILIQICTGSYISWSVYNVPIENYVGSAEGTAAITFYICMGVFGLSGAVMGPVIERYGPAIILRIAAFFLLAGKLLAGLAVHLKSLPLLYFSYGVVAAIGLGTSFCTPVGPMQKSFPENRGVASSVALIGFGLGAVIASKTQAVLIENMSVSWSLVIHGIAFFVIEFLCSFVVRAPPTPRSFPNIKTASKEAGQADEQNGINAETCATNEQVQAGGNTGAKEGKGDSSEELGQAGADDMKVVVVSETNENTREPVYREPEMNWSLLECLKSREYWLIYLTFMLSNVPSLLANARLADMCQKQFHQTFSLSSTVVAVTAVSNLLGRLIFGATSEYLGRKNFYLLALSTQAVIMGLTPMFFNNGLFWAFAVTQFLCSSFSGGSFSLAAAFLTDLFGTRNVGGLFGVIMTAAPSGAGLVGGMIFNAIYRHQVSIYGEEANNVYDINYYWMCASQFVGFVLCLQIPRDLRERLLPSVPGQVFRFRVFGRLLRLQYVPRHVEQVEWVGYLKQTANAKPHDS